MSTEKIWMEVTIEEHKAILDNRKGLVTQYAKIMQTERNKSDVQNLRNRPKPNTRQKKINANNRLIEEQSLAETDG